MPTPMTKDGFATAHAYQAVTALFTRTGTYAATAIQGLQLHPHATFAIRKTSDGDFAYLDVDGEEKRFTLTTDHNGAPVIATIGDKQMPVLA